MEEAKFWIAIWRVIGATVAALAMTIAGCASYQTASIKEMTAAGSNPLDAACAIRGDERGVCIARFASK